MFYLTELTANEGTFREWANLYVYMALSREKNLGLIPATHEFIWKSRTKPKQMFWNQGKPNHMPVFMNAH